MALSKTGNGTQRAFLDDPSVLYISIHRYENGRFYPCGPFGGIESCGEGPGTGTYVKQPPINTRVSDILHDTYSYKL